MMNKKIVAIGVGALGSHFVLFARNLEHPIKLVDMDRVEQKNTLGQFHSKMGLGKNKAQAMQQALQGLWGFKVEAVPFKLTPDNAEALLGDACLVIDATDNAAARRAIMGMVRAHKIPCLHGALAADGSFGQVVWDEFFKEDEEGEAGQATCEDGENLPFHAAVAAQMALSAQKFLKTGTKISYQMTHGSLLRIA
jgi:molybdopterin/thiamine biosynthesis adenylyltransferase